MRRQILDPLSQLSGGDWCLGGRERCGPRSSWRKVEDASGKEVGDSGGHASEPVHEKVCALLSEEGERWTDALSSVRPRIVVIQHVDKHDTQ